MSRQVTVELPEAVLRKAENLATLSDRHIGDVLADALQVALGPVDLRESVEPPVRTLSDERVLSLAASWLGPREQERLSYLLDAQQRGPLDETQRAELNALMRRYEQGLLRKADALAEAVRRGLREPLSS
jgi:hypothetical protein